MCPSALVSRVCARLLLITADYVLSLSLHIQVDRILGCGSALERNPVLQKHVKEVFSLPLLLTAADAAKGAALASLQQSPITHHDTHQHPHT